jgi:hypothetical protein
MSAAHELAAELRRLWFDPRRPHLFDDAKRDLAARIARLATPNLCATCTAQSLRHSLDAARRTARAERDRADRLERMLASAVRRPRRSRAHAMNTQLELWT